MTTQQKVFTYENAKTAKGEPLGWLTAIRYLAPADESGKWNVCANAGACKAVCLYTAGRGAFASVRDARIEKTRWRMTDKAGHLRAAGHEIELAQVRAQRMGLRLAVRLNGTSDLPGDAIQLANQFPHVQFYDYTKLVSWAGRPRQANLRGRTPPNYHLTLSYDPITVPWEVCRPYVHDFGMNVAVAFDVKRGAPLPTHWQGVRVIDGDLSDLRFLDPVGVIVGLRAKGLARHDTGGFVVKP